jgi:hypothetical protein
MARKANSRGVTKGMAGSVPRKIWSGVLNEWDDIVFLTRVRSTWDLYFVVLGRQKMTNFSHNLDRWFEVSDLIWA